MRVAVATVVDVAGVRFDSHVHELFDLCGRRVELEVAVVVAVGKQVQRFERWVLQLV